jgi:hypothetical protein
VLVDAPAVEVTLRRPPPLGVELAVERDDGGVALVDGQGVIVSARPSTLDVDVPAPVAPSAAADASGRFVWAHDHPFPTCFGCGPERDPADALCLYTGPVGDGRFAVPWTPAAWTGERTVDPRFIWAALDCPSSAPVHGTVSAPVVLGRLTLAIDRPVEVGAPHVIQSWREGEDGRKRTTGVALFTAGGARCAVGRAVWIELSKPLAPQPPAA